MYKFITFYPKTNEAEYLGSKNRFPLTKEDLQQCWHREVGYYVCHGEFVFLNYQVKDPPWECP